MKRLLITFGIALIVLSCSAQKEQVFNIDQKKFNSQAEDFLKECEANNKKVVVLFEENEYNQLYYFTFKSYDEYPDWLMDYLKNSNKYLRVDAFKVPLLTSLDYTLYYNKEVSNLPKKGVVVSRGYTYLDGSILGKSNRFIIVLKNDHGRFGKIVPKEDLLEP